MAVVYHDWCLDGLMTGLAVMRPAISASKHVLMCVDCERFSDGLEPWLGCVKRIRDLLKLVVVVFLQGDKSTTPPGQEGSKGVANDKDEASKGTY